MLYSINVRRMAPGPSSILTNISSIFVPSPHAIGRNIGVNSSVLTVPSINMPAINTKTQIMIITMYLLLLMLVIKLCQYVDVCIANEEDAKNVFGIEADDTDITQ